MAMRWERHDEGTRVSAWADGLVLAFVLVLALAFLIGVAVWLA